jgi:hypothetical protein
MQPSADRLSIQTISASPCLNGADSEHLQLFQKQMFDDTRKYLRHCLWNCELADELSAGILERRFAAANIVLS